MNSSAVQSSVALLTNSINIGPQSGSNDSSTLSVQSPVITGAIVFITVITCSPSNVSNVPLPL